MINSYQISYNMGKQNRDQVLLNNIAQTLKVLRAKKCLSQEDVYNDTGIHISRIETGETNITMSTMSSLTIYFEISFIDFFHLLEENKNN